MRIELDDKRVIFTDKNLGEMIARGDFDGKFWKLSFILVKRGEHFIKVDKSHKLLIGGSKRQHANVINEKDCEDVELGGSISEKRVRVDEADCENKNAKSNVEKVISGCSEMNIDDLDELNVKRVRNLRV